MPPLIRKYKIGKNRLLCGCLDGLTLGEDGALHTQGDDVRHILYLRGVDSGRDGFQWGRLRFNAETGDDDIVIVRAFASDQNRFLAEGEEVLFDDFLAGEAPARQKDRVFESAGASRFVGHSDVLLYEQKGRYLWVALEVLGRQGALSEITVFAPGDSFYATFPEIYRMNGDFLHRYLSIFSSLYTDLQGNINTLHDLVDISTAPVGMLPVFAEWLGIQLDGAFLSERHLRLLLRQAFLLIREKGTRHAVERIVRIFVDEPFYLVERRRQQAYAPNEDQLVGERLYGESLYRVTVLLNRAPDEQLHSRLKYLLVQFCPVRCDLGIVFIRDGGGLDDYCYLDINAHIREPSAGATDQNLALDGTTYMT